MVTILDDYNRTYLILNWEVKTGPDQIVFKTVKKFQAERPPVFTKCMGYLSTGKELIDTINTQNICKNGLGGPASAYFISPQKFIKLDSNEEG
jgi:hypothetical protein